MRGLIVAGWLAVVAPLVIAAPVRDASADFDPAGRNKKKPKGKPGGTPGARPGGASPGAKPSGTPASKPGGATSKPDGGAKPATGGGDAAGDASAKPGKPGPSTEALIARYTGIVLSQPSAPFPLQRLAQLYRERDGNLKKLVEDFEKRVAAGGQSTWNARVALAGIYKQDGRFDDAIETYEAAIAERPKDPAAITALAHLFAERGEKAKARERYEQTLPLLTAPSDIEQTRRTLLGLCLDLKELDAAKKHHEALVRAAGGSLFVKAELGRELLARGLFDRAEAEFRDLVKAAAGDNRALAPALRDLGHVLAKQKKTDEALAVLKRALAVAGSAAGVRNEILVIMTDAFRAEGKLPELIAILEAEGGQDFQRLTTLGALYEETGAVDKALATYRKALAIDGRHIDTRLRLVHLLQTAGDLDQAIVEYEALIKAAPTNPQFVFELCETLLARGDRPKALRLLSELESRAKGEPETLAAVADFYERVEEKERALRVLQKLAAAGGGDPQHVIDLGDRYWQAGEKKKAIETWARIRTLVPNRARAAVTLGEVYLDHDMPAEAIAALQEAVSLEPDNLRTKKALAIALERTATSTPNRDKRYAEARAIWEDILAKSAGDKLLAREARTHIVSLWALTHELASRVAPLTARFEAKPPDLEAGRLLAEVQRKLNRLADAEATLRKVVAHAPGDQEAYIALERVLVQQQNLLGAIDVLGKLVEIDPKRAREFYQRMAQYAAELYRDDDAIKYAARAVELSPDDATGHQKLGDMYRRRQDVPHAIAEYRAAIQKNERLFAVYFDLAELLLSTGEADEADRLFRRVARSAPDDDLVARAARMSMQVNLGRGTLETLEKELLPVAVGNPTRTVYRRLLVELYGALTFPLVQKVRHAAHGGTEADAKAALAARAELAKIGTRAVKPLLDALADDREAQQKVAIEVLAYVENKSAGPALFNFALSQAERSLRVRAMIACGALRDPALLPKYEELLLPKEAGAIALVDPVAVAAAWGVARLGDAKADKLLAKLLASPSPETRALAALGLGLRKSKAHVPALAALAGSLEAGPVARAAAVHALGEIGVFDPELSAALRGMAASNDPTLRKAALLTLARTFAAGDGKDAPAPPEGVADAIAAALFSTDASVRADAALAAATLAAGSYRRSGEALGVPDGDLSIAAVLESFAPDDPGPAARARALTSLGAALERAAVAAVATSPDRARVVADALRTGPRAGLAPLLDETAAVPEATAGDVRAVIDRIAKAVVPGFVALERHPVAEVRAFAVALLARRQEREAQAAVVDALSDPDDAVRRAALAAIGAVPDEGTTAAVIRTLREGKTWSLRVRAAEALGRLGGSGARTAEALAVAARSDAYALVREASLRAVAPLDAKISKPLLRERAKDDPEPRVRALAAELLAR